MLLLQSLSRAAFSSCSGWSCPSLWVSVPHRLTTPSSLSPFRPSSLYIVPLPGQTAVPQFSIYTNELIISSLTFAPVMFFSSDGGKTLLLRHKNKKAKQYSSQPIYVSNVNDNLLNPHPPPTFLISTPIPTIAYLVPTSSYGFYNALLMGLSTSHLSIPGFHPPQYLLCDLLKQ